MKAIIIVGVTYIFFMACDDTRQHMQNFTDKDSMITETSFTIPSLDNQYLEELYTTQMKIIVDPANNSYINDFISKAYFKEENTLVTFGNAAVINPQTGEQIARALIKRSALLDAKRWAAYGMHWIKDNPEMEFGEINEIFQGLNKEIYTFYKGDSLVVALASKVQ